MGAFALRDEEPEDLDLTTDAAITVAWIGAALAALTIPATILEHKK